MRLFVALDIDEQIRSRIARFVDKVRATAPYGRWVRPESLHITLKFIGEQSEDETRKIVQALRAIKETAFDVNLRGYGFFSIARAPQVFWIGVDAGPKLTSLAATVDADLASLGIAKEEHSFNPHLTLARGGEGSGLPRKQKGDTPNRGFEGLQKKLAAIPSPEFGTMTARAFFLFQSQLGPGGSKYTKLAGFALS